MPFPTAFWNGVIIIKLFFLEREAYGRFSDKMFEYCPSRQSVHLILTVIAINIGSHFLLYADSVVDNLLPAATPFLLTNYGTMEEADRSWGLMVSLKNYGFALGCLLSVILSARVGRKLQVANGIVLDIVGLALTMFTNYLPGGLMAAYFGRTIVGIGQGMCQTAGTVMLLELPPIRRRGTVLATQTVFGCLGELLSMVLTLSELLGNERQWLLAMGFPIVLLVPSLIVVFFSPESPRYQFMEGMEADAKVSLSYYQTPADASKTISELLNDIAQGEVDLNANSRLLPKPPSDIYGWKRRIVHKIRDSRFIQPLIIGCILQCFVHLDDWLWLSYSTYIFEKLGFGTPLAQKTSLYMSLPQTGLTIAMVFFFESCSRKRLLILPTFGSAALGIASIAVLHVSSSSLNALVPFLAAADLCMAGIAGESVFCIVPELFHYEDRIIGTAIAGMLQNLFGGLLLNYLLRLLNALGTEKVLIPFVLGNILYLLFTVYCVPETSNKRPQEISEELQVLFAGGKGSKLHLTKSVNAARNITSLMSASNMRKSCIIAVQVACIILAFQSVRYLIDFNPTVSPPTFK